MVRLSNSAQSKAPTRSVASTVDVTKFDRNGSSDTRQKPSSCMPSLNPQGFGFGLGFGKNLIIEPRLTYFQFDGLKTDHDWATRGWFKTKTLLVDGLLKIQVPIGPVTPYIMGGPALFWNLQIVPYEGRIDRDLRKDKNAQVVNSSFEYDGSLGIGFSAGAGVTVKIKTVTIGVGARYYRCRPEVNLRGTYKDESTNNISYSEDGDGSVLVMDGILALLSFNI